MDTKKSDDPDTDSFFGRLIWNVILFVACCYLIKLGVCYLVSVRIPLAIIGAIIAVCVITYRIKKWRDYHDDY